MDDNRSKIEQMRGLIATIKQADIAYFRDDRPIMSDRDYDVAVNRLKNLEQKTGIVLSDSPTQEAPGEILESLTEVRHTKPMLSADNTKSVDDLVRFAGGRDVVMSWKLDGLTLVLRYDGGQLQQAITRGREGINAWLAAWYARQTAAKREETPKLERIPAQPKENVPEPVYSVEPGYGAVAMF